MGAVFVTSTGTDIGKTFVATGLIENLRAAGRAVDAIKPVVSGYDSAAAAASDSGILLAALGRATTPAEIERISPWRFRAALSPDLAAAREGRTLAFDALVEFSRRAMAANNGTLLIEGIGGVMVPIEGRRTVLDWMTMLRVPVLLVVGSYLGTVSHTLTALHVLAQRKLDIAGIVVSETEGSALSMDDTIASITRFAGEFNVIGIPRLPAGTHHHPAFGRIASLV